MTDTDDLQRVLSDLKTLCDRLRKVTNTPEGMGGDYFLGWNDAEDKIVRELHEIIDRTR